MIDPSLMPELPPEPPNGWYSAVYTDKQMKAYGLQCYRLAMERAAQACDWTPSQFGENKDCAAAIRALALQEKK
jgi:hypothetical protein